MNKEELMEKFKEVQTHDDFKKWLKVAKENELMLVTKRTHRRVFAFQKNYNPNYAYYLIDDGVSTGRCRWENLWKYLELVGI
jgi:hypothetical protein